jgi:hypothetical protein
MTPEKRQLLYEIKQTNQTLSLNYLIKVQVTELRTILEKERKRVRR